MIKGLENKFNQQIQSIQNSMPNLAPTGLSNQAEFHGQQVANQQPLVQNSQYPVQPWQNQAQGAWQNYQTS